MAVAVRSSGGGHLGRPQCHMDFGELGQDADRETIVLIGSFQPATADAGDIVAVDDIWNIRRPQARV